MSKLTGNQEFNGDVYVYGIGNYNGTNPSSANTIKQVIDSKQDKVLMEKEYTGYVASADNSAKGWILFMNVVPTDDSYYQPWSVRYRLYVNTIENATRGKYDVTIGTAGTTLIYSAYNEFCSGSYYPIYNHLICYHSTQAKYNNRSTHPIKLGVRLQSARTPTTLARNFKIEILETKGCTVTFANQIETYDSAYTDSYYGYATQVTATSQGLQETGDTGTPNYYNYFYYNGFRLSSTSAPLYRYKFVGFDEKMRVIPFNITNQTDSTIVQKTPCPLGFTVSHGMAWYSSTTDITTLTQTIGSGALYRDSSVLSSWSGVDANFNTLVGYSSNNTYHSNVYWCGSYDSATDKFYLDTSSSTSWYVVVSNNSDNATWKQSFTTGKYYWFVGHTGESDRYFSLFYEHPLYYFDGNVLVPVNTALQPEDKPDWVKFNNERGYVKNKPGGYFLKLSIDDEYFTLSEPYTSIVGDDNYISTDIIKQWTTSSNPNYGLELIEYLVRTNEPVIIWLNPNDDNVSTSLVFDYDSIYFHLNPFEFYEDGDEYVINEIEIASFSSYPVTIVNDSGDIQVTDDYGVFIKTPFDSVEGNIIKRSQSGNAAINNVWSNSTNVKGANGIGVGIDLQTNNKAESAFGNYNKSNKASNVYGNAGNTTASHGIGTSTSNRKNAYEIMENGDAYLYGVGGYDGTNSTITGVKTLQALMPLTLEYGAGHDVWEDQGDYYCTENAINLAHEKMDAGGNVVIRNINGNPGFSNGSCATVLAIDKDNVMVFTDGTDFYFINVYYE